MRAIYDFSSKAGESKAKFLSNQWAKHYRRRFATYRAYLEAMEPLAVLDEETKMYKFK